MNEKEAGKITIIGELLHVGRQIHKQADSRTFRFIALLGHVISCKVFEQKVVYCLLRSIVGGGIYGWSQ